jgi:uncharacterized protein (DUF924 family)
MADTIIETIHEYWFGELDAAGLCTNDHNALWFSANEQNDEFCRTRFDAWLELALAGKLDAWTETDRGLIALVILFDQFSRNIHRGTALAFAGDTHALALSQQTIATGHHLRLPAIHRVFLYLPLEHCEDIAVQEECVALFQDLAQVTSSPQCASFSGYAIAHRDVIAQFGRFPHRNAALGRQSGDAELAYLEKHGGF